MSLKPMRLVLLGAPGAGKGTLTSRLLKNVTQLQSISTGDLLRAQILQQTDVGKKAETYIKSGQLLPDSLMIEILKKDLVAKNWLNSQSSWLLDGFPRTGVQAVELEKTLLPQDANINLVVELDVPSEVIIDRIENRWIHAPSGRVYNLSYNPPKVPGKDDVTGEPLTKRADDNVETVKRRLEAYYTSLEPIKKFYGERNVLDKVSGETSDIIFPKLLSLIEKRFT